MKITILVAVLLLILAIAIYFIFFKKTKLPEGSQYTAKKDNLEAVAIIDESISFSWLSNGEKVYKHDNLNISGDEIANLCLKAMFCTKKSFEFFEKKSDKAKKIVFYYQTDKNFNTRKANTSWRRWAKKIGAYLDYTTTKLFHPKLPIAYIRFSLIKMLTDEGQPAIHEYIHLLLNRNFGSYDSEHFNEKIWRTFGKDTIEEKSITFFKNIDF